MCATSGINYNAAGTREEICSRMFYVSKLMSQPDQKKLYEVTSRLKTSPIRLTMKFSIVIITIRFHSSCTYDPLFLRYFRGSTILPKVSTSANSLSRTCILAHTYKTNIMKVGSNGFKRIAVPQLLDHGIACINL